MVTIFSKIILGEIPAYKIAENENCFAFLDINPIAKGHVLVVPKQEVDYIFDLNEDAFTKLFLFAKEVAMAVKKAIPCNRIGVTVIGLEVPHAHIHLIPINDVNDMNFANEKLKLTDAELTDLAKLICSYL